MYKVLDTVPGLLWGCLLLSQCFMHCHLSWILLSSSTFCWITPFTSRGIREATWLVCYGNSEVGKAFFILEIMGWLYRCGRTWALTGHNDPCTPLPTAHQPTTLAPGCFLAILTLRPHIGYSFAWNAILPPLVIPLPLLKCHLLSKANPEGPVDHLQPPIASMHVYTYMQTHTHTHTYSLTPAHSFPLSMDLIACFLRCAVYLWRQSLGAEPVSVFADEPDPA